MTTRWCGASLLVMHDGRLLFGAKVKDGAVHLTGIGGSIEAGESARDCALRECLEETGISATIVDSTYCIDIGYDGAYSERDSSTGEIATVRRYAITPAGEPWSDALSSQQLQVEMFAGCLDGTPQPIEKLPFFVALSAADVQNAASPQGFNLIDALKNETTIRVSGTIPSDCPHKARLVDSPEALILALGDALPDFLKRLSNLLATCP